MYRESGQPTPKYPTAAGEGKGAQQGNETMFRLWEAGPSCAGPPRRRRPHGVGGHRSGGAEGVPLSHHVLGPREHPSPEDPSAYCREGHRGHDRFRKCHHPSKA